MLTTGLKTKGKKQISQESWSLLNAGFMKWILDIFLASIYASVSLPVIWDY